VSLHHPRQFAEVLQVPLLYAAEVVPLPNATTPFSFQEVKIVEVIFETADDFYEFFSCYINNTIIVVTAAEYIEDNCANIPTLSPIRHF
jgi:hypothetical protein